MFPSCSNYSFFSLQKERTVVLRSFLLFVSFFVVLSLFFFSNKRTKTVFCVNAHCDSVFFFMFPKKNASSFFFFCYLHFDWTMLRLPCTTVSLVLLPLLFVTSRHGLPTWTTSHLGLTCASVLLSSVFFCNYFTLMLKQ